MLRLLIPSGVLFRGRQNLLMDPPEEHIRACAEAHERLLSALEVLTDESAREPSLLPGWTRGHVLTHLARKADSHV